MSTNADKRYKLVREIVVSAAGERDTFHFDEVLDPTNSQRDILADKGGVDGEPDARLNQHN